MFKIRMYRKIFSISIFLFFYCFCKNPPINNKVLIFEILPDTLVQLTKEGDTFYLQDVCNCEIYSIIISEDTILLTGECDVTAFNIKNYFVKGKNHLELICRNDDIKQQSIIYNRNNENKYIWFVKVPGFTSYNNNYYVDKNIIKQFELKPADCEE